MKYAPYSFSKINTFFSCQKKFEYSYVNKIPVDSGYSDPSYFKRGRFLHAYIAERLKGGDGTNLGRYDVDVNDKLNLIEYGDLALENELIQMTFDFETTMIEKSLLLDMELKPTNSKSNSALNGFCDYYAVYDNYALIVDWKSGKHHKEPNFAQLELYAIWIIQTHPEITEIDLMFYYVEHNKFELKTITSDDLIILKNDLSNKIKIIEETSSFIKTESKFCNDCPFLNTCIEN